MNAGVPITRIFTILMFGAICFAWLVPLSLQQHDTPLAVVVSVLFAGYLVVNFVLWRRTRPRA